MKDFLKKLLSQKRLLSLAVIFLCAYALGYWMHGDNEEEYLCPPGDASQILNETTHGERELYACPMMCISPQNRPGSCPVCGMNLERVSAGAVQDDPHRIDIALTGVGAAEIRTMPVKRQSAFAEVRLFGEIDYDPAHTSDVTAFMPGVIDRVYVKRAGQFVRWGDRLFDIYSPDLYATEQQLMEVMEHIPQFYAFQTSPFFAQDAPVTSRSGDGKHELSEEQKEALETLTGIRAKLRMLGLPKRDIDELMKEAEPTGIAGVYAPMYGVVTEQNAYEGTFVNTGTSIFTLADPQYVWARLEAYESDFPWLRLGQEAVFHVDAYPGELFRGEVVYIDQIIFDKKKRTFDVGVQFPDKGGRLRAGMVVRATIEAELSFTGEVIAPGSGSKKLPLVIPATAPLITGKRALVYVSDPENPTVFESREVILGPRAKDHYIVLDGLQEGEQVVAHGNFKIDSAAQIQAKKSFLTLEGHDPVDAHHSPGGSDVMERDYRRERIKSRQDTISADPGTTDSKVGPDDRPSNRLPRGGSTIRRRVPGGYGDTTRENTRSHDR